MPSYVKKPIVVEAMRFPTEPLESAAILALDVYKWVESNTLGSFEPDADPVPTSGVSIDPETGKMLIATLEGVMSVSPGDWVLHGVQGEFYPCKPDIFEETYSEVGAV